MSEKFKYLSSESTFKEDAYLALTDQFKNQNEFNEFYNDLKSGGIKNEFLRVSSAYLFFVRNGDWHVDVERSNPVIDYFTNSFKLVALFSIIESLSDKKYVDFYQWLTMKNTDVKFPINDKSRLKSLYDEYKKDYGSIRRCKEFFKKIPQKTQDELKSSIKINGSPAGSIEKVAELLYGVRSNFAHEINNSTEITGIFAFTMHGTKRVVWKLPISLIQKSFEQGLLAYFKEI